MRSRHSIPFILLVLISTGVPGCTGQHESGVMELMGDDCERCHGGEAAAVEDPPHLGNFPATCFECHNTGAWSPAFFSHDNVVSPCYDCHRADYESAGDPPHLDDLPQLCEECHTTDAWSPATFSHDDVAGECYGCHRSDYEGTTNPDHVQDGYPQTCDDCHGTDDWIPALDGFHPEARFPISEGPHEKFQCLECHNADLGPSAAGENTDCVGCHTGDHRREKVDDQHQETPGYLFDENNPHFCLECHPSGRK